MAKAQRAEADPSPKDPSQVRAMSVTMNKRRGFRYCLVAKDGRGTAGKYKVLGWRPIRWDFEVAKDGEQKDKHGFLLNEDGDRVPKNPWVISAMVGDEEQGDLVTSMGNILMEMSEVKWKDIVQNGEPQTEISGTRGQAGLDEVERALIKRRDFVDESRGIIRTRGVKFGKFRHGDHEVAEEVL